MSSSISIQNVHYVDYIPSVRDYPVSTLLHYYFCFSEEQYETDF